MRTYNYCFTSSDPNDSRLVELKKKLKGTQYRAKRVGRTPIPGEKWRLGWLPLYAAQKFDVYIYAKDPCALPYWNATGERYMSEVYKERDLVSSIANQYRA